MMQGQVGQGSMLLLGFMQLAMGAFFALPERLHRVRVGLRIAWASSAFLGLGIALSGFRDYRIAVALVMMVVLVLFFRYLRR